MFSIFKKHWAQTNKNINQINTEKCFPWKLIAIIHGKTIVNMSDVSERYTSTLRYRSDISEEERSRYLMRSHVSHFEWQITRPFGPVRLSMKIK